MKQNRLLDTANCFKQVVVVVRTSASRNTKQEDLCMLHFLCHSTMTTDSQYKRICRTKSSPSTLTNTASSTNRIHRSADSSTTISMTCKKFQSHYKGLPAFTVFSVNNLSSIDAQRNNPVLMWSDPQKITETKSGLK
jgi:hypothetical protein